MKKYILLWAQSLMDFRLQELQAVCELLDIQISYDASSVDLESPFMLVEMPSDEVAIRLSTRPILLRSVYEYWAQDTSYETMQQGMQANAEDKALWQPYAENTTFRFDVFGYNHHMPASRQREIIESFKFMGFKGKIRLRDPQLRIAVMEDWPFSDNREGVNVLKGRRGIWVGRWLCDSQRHLIDHFDLKKRVYIGNTSMEAEASLVMANMAHARPGMLAYDPFVGTGSMLYTSAHFGATVMGSDIDGRHIRGRQGKSVFDSAAQYGVRHRVLDCGTWDLSQHPIRIGGFVDAIVTDPPYGVRAGAKKLGRRDENRLKNEPTLMNDGTFSHEASNYVPPSKPWEMSDVLNELLRQAMFLLRPGGRLVYWMPTVSEDYQDGDVPSIDGMRLVANSEQSFGKWARRLITMEKHADAELTDGVGKPSTNSSSATTGHYDFRKSYFNAFNKDRVNAVPA